MAKSLESFAASLLTLDDLAKIRSAKVTPRNWWRVQAGRFKTDPSFPEFVAQVRAARKREE